MTENVKKLPLTNIQRAYYIGRNHEMEEKPLSTHVYYEMEIDLSVEELDSRLNDLIANQPALRAIFRSPDYQEILADVPEYKIEMLKEHGNNREELIKSTRSSMETEVLDAEKWPLFRFKGLKLGAERTYLFVNVDMLIADAGSLAIMLNKLLDRRQRIPKNQEDSGFEEYIGDKEKKKNSKVYAKAREFWLKDLENFPTYPKIGGEEHQVKNNLTKRLTHTFSYEEWSEAKKRIKERNLSVNGALLAVYAAVLGYWSNQDQYAINLPIADRPGKKNMQESIGDFTSILLLRAEFPHRNTDFWEYAKKTQSKLMETYKYSHFDGVEIMRELAKVKENSEDARMPYVFTSMIFDDARFDAMANMAKIRYGLSQTAQTDLDCQIIEVNGQLNVTWDYKDGRIEDATVNHMFQHFVSMVEEVSQKGDNLLKMLMPPENQQKILKQYNQTRVDWETSTLQRLVIDRLNRFGSQIAIEDGEKNLTYEEMAQRVRRLSHKLQSASLGVGDTVCVICKRDMETIIALLAVVQSGATYVPIEADYPKERKNYIIEKSQASAILEEEKLDLLKPNDRGAHRFVASPEDTAYVIFTSGSTGQPKGVAISQQSVCNTIMDINSRWHVNEKDKVLGISSCCFDLSVYDIFGTLAVGATLVIVPEIHNIRDILSLVQNSGITVWNSVPAIMQLVVEEIERNSRRFTNQSLRLCLLSGDWIPLTLPKKIKGYFLRSQNISLGGATEGTIWSIFHEIEDQDELKRSIPYGSPLANQNMYILNQRDEQCPLDVIGEICIGGKGVAQCYVNDAQKTENAYFETEKYGRIYRTGDYGRIDSMGKMEFMGRRDSQVKISGHRIELSEIESVFQRNEKIENAVAKVEKNRQNKDIIVLYYTGKQELDDGELAQYGREFLPYYMIPNLNCHMDEIPLNANGKVDKKKLVHQRTEENLLTESSGDEVEKVLIEIWKDTLDMDQVHLQDTFLAIGGDSVAMIRILGEIRSRFKVEIPFKDFLQNSSISAVAAIIRSKKEDEPQIQDELKDFEISPERKWEAFPLSELQESYFVGRGNHQSKELATNGYIEIECKEYGRDRLERALLKIINRHDMLRCSIDEDGMQQFHKELTSFEIEEVDASHMTEDAQNQYIKDTRKKFINDKLDLMKPPLIKSQVTKIAEDLGVLHLYVDGLILDGWSYEIFHRELEYYYMEKGEELPPLQATYRDYIEYKKAEKKTQKHARDQKYWIERIPSLPPSATLPVDKTYEELDVVEGDQVECALSMDRWKILEKKARTFGVSPFSVLFTSFALAIARWNKAQRFLLNIPEFDRPPFHEDSNNIIGICSSFLLFDFDHREERTFLELVSLTQKQILELKTHNTFSGMEVVREIYKNNKGHQDVMVPIVFGMMADVPQAEKEMLYVKYQENHTSGVWIDINTVIYNDAIEFNWNCIKGIVEKSTLERIVATQKEILHQAIERDRFWDEFLQVPLPSYDLDIINRANETGREVEFEPLMMDFVHQATAHPHREFLISGEQVLTYEQAWIRVQQMACILQEKGIQKDDKVGLYLPKGIQQVLSILSVLYVGGVYVPLEYGYDESLVLSCLDGIGCHVLLTEENTDRFQGNGLILLDWSQVQGNKPTPIEPVIQEKERLFSIIHTSGSTGKPKAVGISWEALHNSVEFTKETFQINQEDVAFAITNYAHDMSMFDLYSMIKVGGKMVIPKEEEHRDPYQWLKLLEKNRVTIWNSVPMFLQMLMEIVNQTNRKALHSLRLLFLGGDMVKPQLLREFKKHNPHAMVSSVGGPTETTLWNIYHQVTDRDLEKDVIPYGKPIWNNRYHLLNEKLERVPIGVEGTMYCEGIGVTPGYINNVRENAKRLITLNGIRMYNTGDLGKYNEDGDILFLGRVDRQVKISGKRIELEGLEATVNKVEGIKGSYADKSEDGSYLEVYYVATEDLDERIRNTLKTQLPPYMLPKELIRVNELHLTANGKMDRNKIKVKKKKIQKKADAPRDEVEKKLLDIYCKVLGHDIDIHTDFFEAGGNSLMAVQLLNKLKNECDLDIQLAELFTTATISELYELLLKKFGFETLKDKMEEIDEG